MNKQRPIFADWLFWTWLLLIVLVLAWLSAPAKAEPVRFEIETGVVWFKWDVDDKGILPLELSPPKWYVEPQFIWRPPYLKDAGLSVVAGFRWQALGREVRGNSGRPGWNYVDGPKLGIRGSWNLIP